MVDLDYVSDDTEINLNENVDEGKTRSVFGGWMGTPANSPTDDEVKQEDVDGDDQ